MSMMITTTADEASRQATAHPILQVGDQLLDAAEYPLFHDEAHGWLYELVPPTAYAVISLSAHPLALLSDTDVRWLREQGAALVQIQPPDGDSDQGFCDLDMGFTAVLADARCQAMVLAPDLTVIGAARNAAELGAVVAALRMRRAMLRHGSPAREFYAIIQGRWQAAERGCRSVGSRRS